VHASGRTISDWKNILALSYIAASAAPASYIPPLFLVLLVMTALLQQVYGERVTAGAPYVGPLILMLGYMLANGLAAGVPVYELFSYSAVRYDANILYSLLPLFLLGSGRVGLQQVDNWLAWTAMAGTVAYLAFPLIGIQLFESHNAAGGFYMILLAYLVGRGRVDGFASRRWPIAAAVVSLVMSDSRGSIAAVVAAAGIVAAARRWPRATAVGLVACAAALCAGLTLCYQTWVDNGSIYLYDYTEFGAVADTVSLDQIALGERPGTILHRLFFLYPMAIDQFLHSPFFGVGFTRFDDFPVQFDSLAGFVAFNHGPIQHTNLHAHNSYLHIAAETGLAGLAMLALFLRKVFRSFAGHEPTLVPVQVVVTTLMLASLTEHRLTTPSQAAPTFILVGLLWACRRNALAVPAPRPWTGKNDRYADR
jgi:hypothetical protein